MSSISNELNEQIKTWVKTTRKEATDDTLITAILFDNNFNLIYERAKIKDVKASQFQIVPGNTTALYDAIMLATDKVENEDALLMIITDGLENASQQYTYADVKKRIEDIQAKGGAVVYMSSAVEARSEAKKYAANNSTITNHNRAGAQTMSAGMTQSSTAYLNRITNAGLTLDSVPSYDDQPDAPKGSPMKGGETNVGPLKKKVKVKVEAHALNVTP